MKIIISHDVDHIDGWCHWYKDLYWEKFVIKALLFFLRGRISFKMLMRRLTYVFTRRMECVDELMAFDGKYGVPSTFFIGMDNALGMSYSLATAEKMAKHIDDAGFDFGVHGVAYNDKDKIRSEYNRLKDIIARNALNVKLFGVRNHYLRGRGDLAMHQWQSDAGYVFDSTDYAIKSPYKVGTMWEFPLALMDAYILADYDNDMDVVRQASVDALKEAEAKGIPYFTILFHNPSPVFPDAKAWYYWFVDYLSKVGYEFISFKDAIKELNGIRTGKESHRHENLAD